ncbi:response regulator transcription factor [Kribbella sp. NPDC023855]|uniref:response regulator transcription factor n=1 Tax=Kribbella sp. NPDC023855 TaxID=3154698 RepID=UPI0033F89A1B
MRTLIAEDDEPVGRALRDVLSANGYAVTLVHRGADVLLRHAEAQVILLDLGLPDIDGLEVLRKLRRVDDVVVIVLTCRDDERSVVLALRLGADDYLVKPVRLAELLARMEASVRRYRHAELDGTGYSAGGLQIDFGLRQVTVDGSVIHLTPTEFDVLAVLARRAGTAVSREVIQDEIWGDAFLTKSNALDVHLHQLRMKLGKPVITTIRGFGYRLEP